MRKFWDTKKDNLLRRHYPSGDLKALAERLGVTLVSLKSRAHRLHLHRKDAPRRWTQRQLDYLRRHYATMTARELSAKTGHCEKSIYNRADMMGLKKPEGYMSRCGLRVSQHPNSIAVRFKKGHVPSCKGKREHEFRSPEAIEKCRRTQFKKGQRPHNTKPVGYERIDKDGYVLVKVADDKKMVLKHRHVWQQHYGEIPRGYNVMFRDGDRTNCDISNLELVSRQEAARRQVHSETPEQRQHRVERCMATRNKTIRMDKIRIHWGLEPKTRLVKRW